MQRYQNSVLLGGPGCIKPAPYATITVYIAGSLDLATLYQTNEQAPLPNPFNSDDLGNFFFYAEDGRYDIHVVVPGRPEQWLRDTLLEDINEDGLVHKSDIEVKDGLIDPASSWADIPSVGQPNGVGALNAQAQALAARTKQNRDRLDALNGIPGRVSSLELEVGTLEGDVAELQERALSGDFYSYETEAAMLADIPNRAEGDSLKVTNDPDPAKNGYYTLYGGVAVYSGLQPVQESELDAVRQDVSKTQADTADLSEAWAAGSTAAGMFPFVFNITLPGDGVGNMVAYVDARIGTFRALMDQMPGLPYLGAHHRYRVAIDGSLVYGITHAGGFEAAGEPLLDPEYRTAWTQGGRVVLAQRHDGSFELGTGLRGRSRVYTRGAEGARQVYMWNERLGEFQVTNDQNDNWAPELVAGQVYYLTNAGGTVSMRSMVASPDGPFAPDATRVVFALSSGQSLDVGVMTAAATLTPPAPDRLLTFNHGVRRPTDLNDDPIQPEEMERLIPGIANITEPPIVQEAAMRLLGPVRYPANVAIIAETYARGGMSITALGKGTVPYQNGITAAQRVKSLCDQYGRPVGCPHVSWRQGEQDRDMAAGVYTGYLLQLQADYDADLRAVLTDQSTPVKILLDQFSSWTYYDIEESWVPLEQLQVALDHPDKFVCAGPKYQFEHQAGGGVHLTTESSQRLGAKFAAPAVAIEAGQPWLPTHVTSAVRAGATVTLTFHTPYGPLVQDTVNVTDPGNLGIRWIDAGDGNVVTVTGVVVNGDNTVTVTLSDTPTGTQQQIGIADRAAAGAIPGPTTGPRACLRDSSTHIDLQGRPVYNWACHQRIAVTV